jgi:hypothetical protein
MPWKCSTLVYSDQPREFRSQLPAEPRQDVGVTEASRERSSSTPEQAFLEELRRRRADLVESISAVEQASAAPAPGREARWAERVHVALVELAAEFGEHILSTGGPDGLYHEILRTAPLSGAVARLTRDQALIRALIDNLLACSCEPDVDQDVDGIRDRGTTLLGQLAGHRQHGSDLFYEAYPADIGGEIKRAGMADSRAPRSRPRTPT